MLVTALLSNISGSFHLQLMGLQSSANFVCIRFRIILDIVSKLLLAAILICCAFNLNLSRPPFLRQVIDFDLLLCTGFETEHADLFLRHILTQRPMDDGNIELSNECCFGQWQLLSNFIGNFISHDKKKTSVWSSNSFYVVENAKIEDTCESMPTLIHQHVPCYDAS